jgi:hypothetical protein
VPTARARSGRAKLSTTVSPETLEYLERKIRSGEVSSLAEAIDRSVMRVKQLENRERLARATARYFEQLEPRAAAEENSLARDIASAAAEIDFDHEL